MRWKEVGMNRESGVFSPKTQATLSCMQLANKNQPDVCVALWFQDGGKGSLPSYIILTSAASLNTDSQPLIVQDGCCTRCPSHNPEATFLLSLFGEFKKNLGVSSLASETQQSSIEVLEPTPAKTKLALCLKHPLLFWMNLPSASPLASKLLAHSLRQVSLLVHPRFDFHFIGAWFKSDLESPKDTQE